MKHVHPFDRSRAGVTLLEMMFVVAILSVTLATLFGLSLGFGDTVRVQDAKMNAHDEARRAMQTLVADLRQAVRMSINWNQLPGETLTYRVADDVDGNGTAVDVNGRIELGSLRTIGRDLDDANGDGYKGEQLIVQGAGGLRVLANHLSPDSEQPAPDGSFGPSEDTNNNGRLDRGVWFEPWDRGIRITIQTQGTDRRGHVLRYTLQEVVYPRN